MPKPCLSSSFRALLSALVSVVALVALSGCSSGFSARTQAMRTALDEGDSHRAIAELNRELQVKQAAQQPRALKRNDALLILDRATVLQSVADHANSKRDYERADKALDALDLSHSGADTVGRWVFSDSASRYVAPPHEKVLLNVLNMVNYLETKDLSGARIEARRMSVMARYFRDRKDTAGNAVSTSPSLGIGSLLAGFVYEKSGEADEARRYYDDARSFAPTESDAVEPGKTGELLVVVGWGRVPHRIAQHVPIGQALTRAAPLLGNDRDEATRFAAQGLVTWVNYPTLAHSSPIEAAPKITINGRPETLDAMLDVSAEVRAEWARIEGEVMAAAVTRAVARVAVGKAIEGAANSSDKKEVKAIGLILSLFTQIAMTASDEPDTRSWETLPARLGIARVRVPPGEHRVVLSPRGHEREGNVTVADGGWNAVSLFALR